MPIVEPEPVTLPCQGSARARFQAKMLGYHLATIGIASMRWFSFAIVFAPSVIGGLISRQAWWAAGLGALFMYVIMVGISLFPDPDRVIARHEVALELASMLLYGAIVGVLAYGAKRMVVETWRTPSRAGSIVASVMGMFAMYSLLLLVAAAWFYVIRADVRERRVVMFVIDLMVPPLGIVRGFLKYFGVI